MSQNEKSEAGDYLREVRGCGSLRINYCEKSCKKELEKSTSHLRSIVDMFLAQYERNKFHHSAPHSDSIVSQINSTEKIVKKVKTKFELQSQVVHDLGEPLRLKTQQIDKYGYELSYNSSYYH